MDKHIEDLSKPVGFVGLKVFSSLADGCLGVISPNAGFGETPVYSHEYVDSLLAKLEAAEKEIAEIRGWQGKPVTEGTSEQCSPDVYANGVSACLVDIPKEKAEAICRGISAASGVAVDWHYIGGRVHIKAMRVSATKLQAAEARILVPVKLPDDGLEDCINMWPNNWRNDFDTGYNFGVWRCDQNIKAAGYPVEGGE